MEKVRDRFLMDFARSLSHNAKLPVDKVGYILQVAVKTDKRLEHFDGWDWSYRYKNPIYDSWRKHLRELANHYKSNPLPEKMEFLPIKKKEDFKAYTHELPGIQTHKVSLYSGALKRYLKWHTFDPGTLRLPEEIGSIELNHDLIYEKSIPNSELCKFVLDYLGLEVVEVKEQRNVWVAHYDGRPLKPYKEVKTPVPYDNKGKYKTGMATSWGRVNMASLLKNFMLHQDEDLKADKIIIIDETGIKSKPDTPDDWDSVAVSSEGPCWKGDEAIKMARKWFKEEFGVTFTEKTRPMTIHVVRRKTNKSR